MAWGAPEDDEDVYGEVGKALADPAGTYAGENSEVPEETPKIADGAPSTVKNQRDDNREGDDEVNYLAGNTQGRQQVSELADAELPEAMRAGVSAPPDDGNVASTTPEQGDEGDQESAALAGTETFKAPPALSLTPYADHSADEQAMVAQKAKENPANYRPSTGRRILAGIASGMVGYGTRNSGEAMNVGEQITGAPLHRAQEEWKAQEAPLKAKLDANRAADQAVTRQNTQATAQHSAAVSNLTTAAHVNEWNAMAQQRRAQATAKLNTVDRNTLGPVDPNNPFGEWQGKTPNGQVVRGLEPPAAVQKDPKFISYQRRKELGEMQKMGIKLSTQEAKYYLINGKLAEPSQHTTISIHEKPDGSWDESRSGSGSGRGKGPAQQNISDTVAKATQDKEVFANQWKRIDDEDEAKSLGAPVGSYVNGTKTMSPDEFKAHIDKFRTDANVKLNKYGAHIDEQGQLHTEPGQPQLTPGQPQQQQPQQQAQPQASAAPNFPAGKSPGTRSVTIPGGTLDIPEKALPDLMSGKLKIQGNKGETLVYKDGKFQLEQKKK
jgi:hypothetical protein